MDGIGTILTAFLRPALFASRDIKIDVACLSAILTFGSNNTGFQDASNVICRVL